MLLLFNIHSQNEYTLQHHLCNFVHLMGGSVRKEMINSVTHVVANTVFGSKYKVNMHMYVSVHYNLSLFS